MSFRLAIHDPGAGSAKPIDIYEAEDADTAFGVALFYGARGRAVLLTEQPETKHEPAPDTIPARNEQVG